MILWPTDIASRCRSDALLRFRVKSLHGMGDPAGIFPVGIFRAKFHGQNFRACL